MLGTPSRVLQAVNLAAVGNRRRMPASCTTVGHGKRFADGSRITNGNQQDKMT